MTNYVYLYSGTLRLDCTRLSAAWCLVDGGSLVIDAD